MNITVLETSGSRSFAAKDHQNLLSALRENGVAIDAPCSGTGKCGKCRVVVSGAVSALSDAEKQLLTQEERLSGVRLACQTYPQGDCVVRLLNAMHAGNAEVRTDGRMGALTFSPKVSLHMVHCQAPTLANQIPDEENVMRAAEGVERLSSAVCRHLPQRLRENEYTVQLLVRDNIGFALRRTQDSLVLGLAVDIGTTTVAAYLYDLLTGKRLGIRSGLNAQRSYGADVISRISAAMEDGLQPLQTAIVGQLNSWIESFCKELGAVPEDICDVTIAGNTTMLHLLAGYDPRNIAGAPFIPASAFGTTIPAVELGLHTCVDTEVYLGPCVSGYVGGDITLGMISAGATDTENLCLYLDIGTNGEMAAGTKDGYVFCATAAGPAFEGAEIRYGTGGVPGAISRVYLQPDGDIGYETIGDEKPVGICGSGLIDAVRVMLELEVLDETGRICEQDEAPESVKHRLEEKDEPSFILDIETGIAITQQDIRELQLAKAAIAAGIRTLLDTYGATVDQVDSLKLAGGFGSYIDAVSACAIGLLPKELLDRIEVVGNAAGAGASMALLDQEARDRAATLRQKGRYVELSGNATFQNAYIEEMCFE